MRAGGVLPRCSNHERERDDCSKHLPSLHRRCPTSTLRGLPMRPLSGSWRLDRGLGDQRVRRWALTGLRPPSSSPDPFTAASRSATSCSGVGGSPLSPHPPRAIRGCASVRRPTRAKLSSPLGAVRHWASVTPGARHALRSRRYSARPRGRPMRRRRGRRGATTPTCPPTPTCGRRLAPPMWRAACPAPWWPSGTAWSCAPFSIAPAWRTGRPCAPATPP